MNARERISHYLLQYNQSAFGTPFREDQTLVRWWLNSRSMGTREQVWVPNSDFLDRWFPGDDDGSFIEIDDRFWITDSGSRGGNTNATVLYPPSSSRGDGDGENKENYRWFFNLRSNNGHDDYSHMINFAQFMDPGDTSNSQYDERLFEELNVEEMLRIWAVRVNTDDWDHWGVRRGKNSYIYRPEIDGRWHMFAQDMELTYGSVTASGLPTNPSSTYNPGNFSEVNRFFNRPKVKRMWYAILKEMVVGSGRWFHSSNTGEFATKISQLGMSNTGIAQPGGYIDQRANHITPRIQGAIFPQVQLEITTNNGNSFSTAQPTVNLAGDAPAEACLLSITRNGEPLAVDPASFSNMTDWSLQEIFLLPGNNTINVVGFDLQGNFVDSDSIVITFTGGPLDPPTVASVTPDEASPGETVQINGSDFLPGLSVFFGATESPNVTYDPGVDPASIVAEVPLGAGTVDVTVVNPDDQASNGASFTFIDPPPIFLRGDANDDQRVDLADGIAVFRALFGGGSINCEDAADADDNETLNMTDGIYVLRFLFQNGPAPRAPYPSTDRDPSGDTLGCER